MINTLAILLLALGMLLAAVAIVDLVQRRRRQGIRASNTLMRAGGLRRRDRRLLRQIAEVADLPNAGCLLISHGCFEHAAREATARGMDRDAINALQHRVENATAATHDKPVHTSG